MVICVWNCVLVFMPSWGQWSGYTVTEWGPIWEWGPKSWSPSLCVCLFKCFLCVCLARILNQHSCVMFCVSTVVGLETQILVDMFSMETEPWPCFCLSLLRRPCSLEHFLGWRSLTWHHIWLELAWWLWATFKGWFYLLAFWLFWTGTLVSSWLSRSSALTHKHSEDWFSVEYKLASRLILFWKRYLNAFFLFSTHNKVCLLMSMLRAAGTSPCVEPCEQQCSP